MKRLRALNMFAIELSWSSWSSSRQGRLVGSLDNTLVVVVIEGCVRIVNSECRVSLAAVGAHNQSVDWFVIARRVGELGLVGGVIDRQARLCTIQYIRVLTPVVIEAWGCNLSALLPWLLGGWVGG